MGHIRPLTGTDIPVVAALFQRIFRQSGHDPSPELIGYLQELYIEDEACAADLPSLVHVAEGGEISGFVGRHVLPMRFGDRPVRAALLTSIMVDERSGDPLAGAKMLRAALNGPQDFSFSETASEVSMRMWKHLGGIALPSYSLDWVRVIRPAAFALENAERRYPRLGLFKQIASRADNLFQRRTSPDRLRWLGVSATLSTKGGISIREIGQEAFADLFAMMTERFLLRPGWSREEVLRVISKTLEKPEFGHPAFCAVLNRVEEPIGGFFYHWRPQITARIVQMLAAPSQEETVVDAVIAHAATKGANAVRGRTQPFLMEAMLGKRIAFINSASSVLHCRDPHIRQAIQSGNGFLNGLAGEQWSRLIGGHFG